MKANLQLKFDNLADITGLPFVKKGNRLIANVYIDGSDHRKRDKVYAVLKKNGIYIKENGGDDISLKEWLSFYGNPDAFKNKYKEKEHSEVQQIKRRFANEFTVDATLPLHYTNYLFNFISELYGKDDTTKIFKRYNVGEVGRTEVVFWYQDEIKNFCHDARILYTPTGKRNKESGGYRKLTIDKGFSGTCLFGAHLIPNWDGKIAVVESEKTALIMALSQPDILWLATGGANKVMQIKENYLLHPDIDDAGSKWECINCKIPFSERKSNGDCLMDMMGNKYSWGCSNANTNIVQWWDNNTPSGWDIGDLEINTKNLKND